LQCSLVQQYHPSQQCLVTIWRVHGWQRYIIQCFSQDAFIKFRKVYWKVKKNYKIVYGHCKMRGDVITFRGHFRRVWFGAVTSMLLLEHLQWGSACWEQMGSGAKLRPP
jgi:hypothetical protein